MARKSGSLAVAANDRELASASIAYVERLMNNRNVKRFDISIDKAGGIARFTAIGHDVRASTREVIGPGLTTTLTYIPGDKQKRDENIAALHQKGLNQTEIARALNVSQSLVSNVQRRVGLR